MRTTIKTALTALAVISSLAAASVPAAAAPAEPRGGYVATIEILGGPAEPGEEARPNEKFRVQLIERQDIEDAFAVLRSDNSSFGKHINGKIVRTPSRYNPGYSWHLDPRDLGFYERSWETCDGQPSFVTADWWNDPRFCPWQGKVVKMERVRR